LPIELRGRFISDVALALAVLGPCDGAALVGSAGFAPGWGRKDAC
jgi:hypothetical protein